MLPTLGSPSAVGGAELGLRGADADAITAGRLSAAPSPRSIAARSPALLHLANVSEEGRPPRAAAGAARGAAEAVGFTMTLASARAGDAAGFAVPRSAPLPPPPAVPVARLLSVASDSAQLPPAPPPGAAAADGRLESVGDRFFAAPSSSHASPALLAPQQASS